LEPPEKAGNCTRRQSGTDDADARAMIALLRGDYQRFGLKQDELLGRYDCFKA